MNVASRRSLSLRDITLTADRTTVVQKRAGLKFESLDNATNDPSTLLHFSDVDGRGEASTCSEGLL